jgi:hypothetical protein
MRLADERLVHQVVDAVDLPWLAPEQVRRDLRDPGPRSGRVRGDVDGPERRALAPASTPVSVRTRTMVASKLRYSRPRERRYVGPAYGRSTWNMSIPMILMAQDRQAADIRTRSPAQW